MFWLFKSYLQAGSGKVCVSEGVFVVFVYVCGGVCVCVHIYRERERAMP